jgi:hypothetical protein
LRSQAPLDEAKIGLLIWQSMILRIAIRFSSALGLVAYFLLQTNSDGEMASNLFLGFLLLLNTFSILIIGVSSFDQIYQRARGLIDLLIAGTLLISIIFIYLPLTLFIINHWDY